MNPDFEVASNFISHWKVFSSAAGRRNRTIHCSLTSVASRLVLLISRLICPCPGDVWDFSWRFLWLHFHSACVRYVRLSCVRLSRLNVYTIVCLWGDFSGPHIENVFRHLDREGGHNLSRCRTRKEMKSWAQNDSWLNGEACVCMHGAQLCVLYKPSYACI